MIKTNYRCFKRFNDLAMFGGETLDVPEGTELYTNGDDLLIFERANPSPGESKTKAVCHNQSQNCYDYFMPILVNESKKDWLEKVEYYLNIRKKTSTNATKDKCYDAFFYDEIANKYRKLNDDTDRALFAWDYFKLHFATLSDLQYMWNLIKNL